MRYVGCVRPFEPMSELVPETDVLLLHPSVGARSKCVQHSIVHGDTKPPSSVADRCRNDLAHVRAGAPRCFCPKASANVLDGIRRSADTAPASDPVWLAALALRAFCNVFRLHYNLFPLRPVSEFLGSAGRLFARFIRLLRDPGFHLLMNAAGHQLGPLGKILQNLYLIRQRLQFLTKLGNDFHQIAQLLLFRFQLLAQLSIFLSQARVELVSSAPARHTIFGLDSGTTWIHLLSDSAPNFKLGGNRHCHQADLPLRQHHLSPNQDNALRSAWINRTALSKLTFMPQFHIFYRFMI